MSNPYQSPESSSALVKRPILPLVVRALTFMLKIVLLGAAIGAGMGIALCFVLSGGSAADHFYVTYGLFCGTVGLGGGFLAGLVLGFIRCVSRTT
jgi:hypothetical protein